MVFTIPSKPILELFQQSLSFFCFHASNVTQPRYMSKDFFIKNLKIYLQTEFGPDSVGEMKEIPLTRGHVALVDDEDFEALNQYKWHSSAQGSQKKPYACRKQTINGKRVKIWMHRLIMNCPSDMVVDHIDGNGLNNTRGNLEVVTFHENYIRSQEKRKMTVEDCWL